MQMALARRISHALVLFAALFVTGCVVTASGIYFTATDFEAPKAVTGDWRLDPTQGTDKTADVIRVRIAPIAGGLHRATPLTAKGNIDLNEAPADFGLVPLGGTNYLVVNVEDEGDGKKSNFLGLDAQEDKLTFYVFDGGSADATKAAFGIAVEAAGLSLDASKTYEARLSGVITQNKIIALFKTLMADPAKYEADVSVYVKK
jgi:hypothetical protein